MLNEIIPVLVSRYPAVIPHLKGWFFKSYDFYLRTLQNLVRNVYDGYIGGEFLGIMNNLVSGQLYDALETASRDNGLLEPPQEAFNVITEMIANERTFIDGLYRDIVDARVDEKPVDGLLSRAEIWANRWNDAYNEATRIITASRGGKLEWKLGATEQHCTSCAALNGMVAFADEWQQAGLRPQAPPNHALECGGWQCDCSLSPTERRRSPDVFARLLDIAAIGRL